MNAPDRFLLPDIQAIADARRIAIQRVGVRAVMHPLRVRTRCGEQSTVVQVNMYVGLAEEEASRQLWGLLKRPDEKFVTERAYDNPKFVEDLVRDIALRLDRETRARAYVVESENFESIHNHSAYALVEHDKDARQS